MRKFFFVLMLFLGLFFIASVKPAHAWSDTDTTSVRHAYTPRTNYEDRWMNARVDNFIPEPVTRLVCVEAVNVATGYKTHLGCLSVQLDSFRSDGAWAFEFNAPTWMLGQGTYQVNYTYQAFDGSWQLIKSVSLHNTPGIYSNP